MKRRRVPHRRRRARHPRNLRDEATREAGHDLARAILALGVRPVAVHAAPERQDDEWDELEAWNTELEAAR